MSNSGNERNRGHRPGPEFERDERQRREGPTRSGEGANPFTLSKVHPSAAEGSDSMHKDVAHVREDWRKAQDLLSEKQREFMRLLDERADLAAVQACKVELDAMIELTQATNARLIESLEAERDRKDSNAPNRN